MSTAPADSRDVIRALQPIIDRCADTHHWRVLPGNQHPSCIRRPATARDYREHSAAGAPVGLAPIAPGESTTRLAVLDLDSHGGDTPWERMVEVADGLCATLRLLDCAPVPFRSRGGRGVHIYLLWEHAQDAYSVRAMLRDVLAASGLCDGNKGGVAAGRVEIFPKQDSVPDDGFGSMFLLPWAGRSAPLDDFNGWPMSDPVPQLAKPERAAQAGLADVPPSTLRDALAAIPNTDAVGYDEWRNVVFAIHHATDGSDEGLALAHAWSAQSPKYDPAFLDGRVWPHIRSGRDGPVVTAGTLFAMAREQGWVDAGLDDFPTEDPVPAPKAKAGKFRLVTESELEARPNPTYVIDGWIPERGVGLAYGPSGVGKSFVMLHLSACIARGLDVCGRRTHPRAVAYVFAEAAGSAKRRLAAWREHYGQPTGLAIVEDAPSLSSPESVKALIAVLVEGGIRVVVIDTLSCAMGAADETNEGFNLVLAGAKAIAKAIDGFVWLVHHPGKDEGRGARGGSSLRAGVDVEITVQRPEAEEHADVWPRTVEVLTTKARDDEAPRGAMVIKLHRVELGVNEDLTPITSLAAQFSGENANATPKTSQRQARTVSPTEAAVFNVMGDQVGSIALATLVERVCAHLPAPPTGQRDTRKQTVKRLVLRLIETKRLCSPDDFVTEGSLLELP